MNQTIDLTPLGCIGGRRITRYSNSEEWVSSLYNHSWNLPTTILIQLNTFSKLSNDWELVLRRVSTN